METEKTKIKNLIQECYETFTEAIKNYEGLEKIDLISHEQGFYKVQFARLKVNPSIVASIYTEASSSGNDNNIQKIKDNLEKYLN